MGLRTNVSKVLAMRGLQEEYQSWGGGRGGTWLPTLTPPLPEFHIPLWTRQAWFLFRKNKNKKTKQNTWTYAYLWFSTPPPPRLFSPFKICFIFSGAEVCAEEKSEVQNTQTCRKSQLPFNTPSPPTSAQSDLTLIDLLAGARFLIRRIRTVKMDRWFLCQGPEWGMEWPHTR